MKKQYDTKKIIRMYKKGAPLRMITYSMEISPTTLSKILKENKIEPRKNVIRAGFYDKEKLNR